MNALQAHLLKLTIDRLNARAMSTDQSSVFRGIAFPFAVLLRNEPHVPIDLAQLQVLVADTPFIGDDYTAFRQRAEQILHQGQLIPFGRQQLKADWHTRRIIDQMQLPTELDFAFASTISQLVISLDSAKALSAHTLADRNRHGVNHKHVARRHHLAQHTHDEQQRILQGMQAKIEPRHAQRQQVARLLQQTRHPFMMIVKELGGHHHNRHDLGATNHRSPVLHVADCFQNIINYHINRYNVGGVYDVSSSDGRVRASFLTRAA